MAEKCTVCNEMIEPSKQAWSENTCGVHYAHTACVRAHETEFGCSECDPSLAVVPKVVDDDEPTLESIDLKEEEDVPQLETVPAPISLPSAGIFSSIRRLTSKVGRDNVETSDNPFFLVKNHYPVEMLLNKKKMGLLNLVNEHGVSIEDFVTAKYTFKELLGFPEIDCVEGLGTLIGMGLNYTVLYEHRRQLPFDELRAKYGLTSQDIIDRLGYQFCVPSDGGWSAKYLIKSGFNMDQLMACGLEYSFQLDSLDLDPDQFHKLGCGLRHTKKLKALRADREETYVPVSTRRSGPVQCVNPSDRRQLRRTRGSGDEDTCIGQNFRATRSLPVIRTKKKSVKPPHNADIGYVRVIPTSNPGKLVFPGEVLRKKRYAHN